MGTVKKLIYWFDNRGRGGQVFLYDWLFAQVSLNVDIMMWHMGYQGHHIPELKLFKPYYFKHVEG